MIEIACGRLKMLNLPCPSFKQKRALHRQPVLLTNRFLNGGSLTDCKNAAGVRQRFFVCSAYFSPQLFGDVFLPGRYNDARTSNKEVNTMNFKYKKLLPLALVAALLLTGCTALVSLGVSTAGDSTTAAVSQIAPDADAVGSDQTAEVIAVSDTSPAVTADETTSDAYDEAFSGRDLSGEYDSEVVSIRLSGDSADADSDAVIVSGSTVTITAAGTYVLSGELNGTVVVNASKDDKVQLVLDGVTIETHSSKPNTDPGPIFEMVNNADCPFASIV